MANGIGLAPDPMVDFDPSYAAGAPAVAPPVAVAQMSPSQTSPLSSNPLAAIGYLFAAVGAGLQGKPLPVDQLRKMKLEDEELEMRRMTIGMSAISNAHALTKDMSDEDREKYIKGFTVKFGKVVGPDFEDTMRTALKRPDAGPLLEFFGEHKDEMLPIVKYAGMDKALALFGQKDFREMMDAKSDGKNLPMAQAKVEQAAAVMRAGVESGQLPATAFDKFAKDDKGTLLLSPDQLGQLNAVLPKEFQLSAGEMGAIGRRGYQGNGLEIMSRDTAKKASEARALEATKGKEPTIQTIEDAEGNKSIVALDKQSGQPKWKLPAGVAKDSFSSEDFKTGLTMIAAGKFPAGIKGGTKQALSSINSSEEAGTLLEALKPGGMSIEQGPDGALKINIGGGKGGMTQSQAGQLEQERVKAEMGAKQALALSQRMREQMTDEPLFGLAGSGAQWIEGLVSQARSVAEKSGGTESVNILDPKKYDFGKLTGEAAKSAAFKSNLINLAYATQRAKAPGDRITDKDLQSSIDALGSATGSRAQFEAALTEQENTIKRDYAIRHKTVKKEDIGPDFWGAGGGKGAYSIDDLKGIAGQR